MEIKILDSCGNPWQFTCRSVHQGELGVVDREVDDKLTTPCAQVGDFRVINPGIERSSVYIFKAHSETEVVQVTRNTYEGISIVDGETTVDQLKTAFSVK